MTPEERTHIVLRLRAMADDIEGGAEADAYSDTPSHRGFERHYDIDAARDEARDELAKARDLCGDGWPDDVEQIEYGILVRIGAARCIERRRGCRTYFDHWEDYGLVDPAEYSPPETGPCDDDTCEECFPPTCRVCGCTDDDCEDCIERTGEPCFWVEEDLCSACATPAAGEPAP